MRKEKKAAARFIENQYSRYQPRLDHPFFQQAFGELVGLLAAEFNGNPAHRVRGYLFIWILGRRAHVALRQHSVSRLPNRRKTWVKMIEVQLEHFTKTPLMTNTQPDYSRVGNSEVLDLTIRSHNWIRSDTIFIENEQIETLSNRPPWIAAALEQGIPAKSPDVQNSDEGISRSRKHDCSRNGRGGELLVAVELSLDQRQESAELLPGIPEIV